VVARGIVAIGQFGCGVVCSAQSAVGGLVLAQFAAAYSLIAQCGVYVAEGHGHAATCASSVALAIERSLGARVLHWQYPVRDTPS